MKKATIKKYIENETEMTITYSEENEDYQGKLIGISKDGKKVKVHWTDDDDESWEPVGNVQFPKGKKAKKAAKKPSVKKGDMVDAYFNADPDNEDWYEAKVIKVGNTSVKVKYTDDDFVESVPFDRIRETEAKPESIEWAADDNCMALFEDEDEYYPATVVKVNKNKTVRVEWHDGTGETTLKADLLRLPEDGEIVDPVVEQFKDMKAAEIKKVFGQLAMGQVKKFQKYAGDELEARAS